MRPVYVKEPDHISIYNHTGISCMVLVKISQQKCGSIGKYGLTLRNVDENDSITVFESIVCVQLNSSLHTAN